MYSFGKVKYIPWLSEEIEAKCDIAVENFTQKNHLIFYHFIKKTPECQHFKP